MKGLSEDVRQVLKEQFGYSDDELEELEAQKSIDGGHVKEKEKSPLLDFVERVSTFLVGKKEEVEESVEKEVEETETETEKETDTRTEETEAKAETETDELELGIKAIVDLVTAQVVSPLEEKLNILTKQLQEQEARHKALAAAYQDAEERAVEILEQAPPVVKVAASQVTPTIVKEALPVPSGAQQYAQSLVSDILNVVERHASGNKYDV